MGTASPVGISLYGRSHSDCQSFCFSGVDRKPEYRRELVGIHSARNICGYVYSNSGEGESTTDLVYSGHSVICENGAFLAERMPFEKKMLLYGT